MRPLGLSTIFLALALGTASSASASGCEAETAYLHGQTIVDKPIYNTENDTWYELVSVHNNWPCRYGSGAVDWPTAQQLSYTLTHEGRRGRLAIVDSAQIHEFLAQFQPKRLAWIGLRYWCNYGRAKWVDGRTYKLSDFSAWGSPWNIGGISRFGDASEPAIPLNCRPNSRFWPVHYWSTNEGFVWNANGPDKHGRLFFVEFPPLPKDENSAKADEKHG